MAPDVLCIGSVLWDVVGRTPLPMRLGDDVPGSITRVPGGVAMNIAMTLRRFGLRPALLTAIGRDPEGETLAAEAERLGLVVEYAHRSEDLPTDRYMAVEASNGLIAAIADAHSLEAAGDKILRPLEDGRLGSPEKPWGGLIALDGNLTTDLLASMACSPLFLRADLRLAPASPGKAQRLRPLLGHPRVTAYLNLEEARLLGHQEFGTSSEAAAGLVSQGAHRVLVTDGGRHASYADASGVLTAPPPEVPVHRVTGAGDTFMAAHIVAEMEGAGLKAALSRALKAAALYVSGDNPV